MKETEKLANFIVKTSFEDIPEKANLRAKWSILDCIGTTFAGLQNEAGKKIISFVKDLGGNPTSTIIGDGYRTSAPWAAYANGTLAHAIDFDDMNRNMGHPTAPVLSALLAVGEKVGATGKEILLSFILGLEVEGKIGLAINRRRTSEEFRAWHATPVTGTFGAAAACSKIMHLNQGQTLMALGMSGSQSSGLKQNFGTMTKPLHVGQAAKNGVLSSLLASRGWTANGEILEGHFGLYNFLVGEGAYDLTVFENLGRPFDVVEPGFELKKYPCCGSTHPSLDAITKMLSIHNLSPADVESVECELNPFHLHVLRSPNPKTGLGAKFSLHYCLASAIVRGKISLADFTDEQVNDDEVQTFLPKVKIHETTSLRPWLVKLRIHLKNGEVLEGDGDRSPGITDWEGLVTKYEDCLNGSLPAGKIQQSLEMIQEIEKMKEVSELVNVLKVPS